MDKFVQSLAYLLPQGYAWPRNPDTVLMRTLSGVAAAFSEVYDWAGSTVYQWQPCTTVSRLAEWEAATGLPDPCFGIDQSEALRRELVLSRLRGVDLPDDTACPGAPGVIEDECRALGLGYSSVTVRYNLPFRVGRNRVGQRLGRLNGVLNVFVDASSVPFRVGRNRVGDRLVRRIGVGPELACHLARIVPARYQINVIFT